MPTQKIQLIATDMDGTLLNSSQRISPATLRALKRAQAMGVRVALCSGRIISNAASVAISNGLDGMIVMGLNGANCTMSIDEEPYNDIRMDNAAFAACLERLKPLGGRMLCCSPRVIVTLNAEEQSLPEYSDANVNDLYRTERFFGFEALERIQSATKLVYIDDNAERLSLAARLIEDIENVDVTSSWHNNIEIMPSGINKGAAIRSLAGRLGLPMSGVMAFGDYDNDITMLASAGLGVAMGNANERVKLAARYVTESNDEDGIARAVERFVLCDN